MSPFISEEMRKIYGSVYRSFRKGKHITQEEACRGLCSRKTLSNFEGGYSTPGFDVVYGLLQNINLSLMEFSLKIEKYCPQTTVSSVLFEENSYCDKNFLETSLAKLLAKPTPRSAEDEVCILAFSQFISAQNPDFIKPNINMKKIADYFFSLEQWRFSDFQLFANVASSLKPDLVIMVMKKFFKEEEFCMVNSLQKRTFNCALINSAYLMIREYRLLEAERFLDKLTSILDSEKKFKFVDQRSLKMYLEGFLQVIKGEKSQGICLMSKAIQIFHLLGDEEMADYYSKLYLQDIRYADEFLRKEDKKYEKKF